jgi:hypothetical protein
VRWQAPRADAVGSGQQCCMVLGCSFDGGQHASYNSTVRQLGWLD